MKFFERRVWIFVSTAMICATMFSTGALEAATKSARQQVRTGLEQHAAGDYSAAADSFAQAQKELTEEPRVVYDRACALAAQGKADEATDLFRQTSIARIPKLAANSHYNLGRLVSQEVKELFGDDPASAEAEAREQGTKLIHQAVMHYRDCLRVDSEHAAARRNLEVLRLWLKHMNDVWAKRDRDKRRDEMDLLQFLEWIDTEQRSLEAATKALGTLDGSPRQRQAISQVETSQRLLAEEIEPLREKLRAALTNDQPADTTTEKAVATIDQIVLKAKSSMFRAADELVAKALSSATSAQDEAIDSLNEVYSAVAPYGHILQKATKVQDSLLSVTTSLKEEDQSDDSMIDRDLLSRDQGYIVAWSQGLVPRARQGLTELPTGQVQQPQGPPTEAEQEKQKQMQAAMKESYEKAIELAPKIAELATSAEEDLNNGDWKAAHPKQDEALKLLKEITPKTPPDEDKQDQDDQENQDQQNDNQDQQGDDNQQQDQSDEQKEQQEKNEQQDKQQQQQKDVSRQQAEALLSKARQREREHRDRKKEQLRAIQGAIRVERDW